MLNVRIELEDRASNENKYMMNFLLEHVREFRKVMAMRADLVPKKSKGGPYPAVYIGPKPPVRGYKAAIGAINQATRMTPW